MLYSIFLKRLHELAPFHTSLENDFYGMQFGELLKDHNLRKIAVTIYPSKKMIKEAMKENCSMILSLHGLVNFPVLQINDFTINQIKLLAMSNLKLFVLNSGWECATGGVLEALASYLGLKIVDSFICDNKTNIAFGRIAIPLIETESLSRLVESFKRHCSLSKIQICGNLTNLVKKLLIMDGIRINEAVLLKVAKLGVDTLLTCDISSYHSRCARTLKFNIISLPRQKFEEMGMLHLQQLLSLEFPRDEFVYISSDDTSLITV